MDNSQKNEVVIFENPQAAQKSQSSSQQDTPPQQVQSPPQQPSQTQPNQKKPDYQQRPPQDDKDEGLDVKLYQQEGFAEGIKEGEKEMQKTKQTSPDALQKSGQQEGIKEAVKEAEKIQQASDATYEALGQKEGIKESTKESVKGQQAAQGKLDSLVEKTQQPLLMLKTNGFGFNLMPDIFTIDAIKVSVTFRSFLRSEQVRSVFVKDIADVFVESIPFAAALRIIDNADKENPLLIKPFKKEDAEKAKSIIVGLLAAHKENIDVTSLEGNIVEKISQLGTPPQG